MKSKTSIVTLLILETNRLPLLPWNLEYTEDILLLCL